MADVAVVGRDRELERIDEFLAFDEPRRVLVVEGEAGIGKTTLWSAAVERAARRGYRVLSCAAVETETRLSFTALRDLLAGVFDDVAERLPSPQRRALDAMLLLRDPTRGAADPATIAVAFLSALRLLAEEAPTIVAVDDIQWLDVDSAGSLGYTLRRLRDGRAAAILARRTEAGLEISLDVPPEAERMPVSALSIGALGRILHETLDVVFPRPTLQRITETSGGNPLFALELARALGDAGEHVIVGALPVPQTLRELVEHRVAKLPRQTRDVLAVTSALTRPTIGVLARATGLDVVDALGPAVEAEIATATGERVRFTHPLYASAVYGLAAGEQLREIHRRLAEIVANPEERARHLALATDVPDREVAAAVEDAAAYAFARGSPSAAAELAFHASRLTPETDGEDARRRTLAHADYEFAAGDTARASTLLAELLPLVSQGTPKAAILMRQARIALFAEDEAASAGLFYEALAEAAADDELRGEIEEGLSWALLLARRDLPAAVEHARAAARLADARHDSAALAEALAAQALTECVTGEPWRTAMDRALELEPAMLDARVLRHPSFAFGYCLLSTNELEAAREVFETLERRADEAGDAASLPEICKYRALLEHLSGDAATAERYADEGCELALETGQEPNWIALRGKKALIAAAAGRAEEATTIAREALATACGREYQPSDARRAMMRGGESSIWALGLLALSRADYATAQAMLEPMSDVLIEAGVREPGEARCVPDTIEALIGLGQLDEGEALLAQYARWPGSTRRSSLSTVGRCRGLLFAARGDLDAAADALGRAAGGSDALQIPLEQGRTLLVLGSLQLRLRERRTARETLTAAQSVFDVVGAEIWSARAAQELGRIGGRTAASEGLTPAERRIAELVATGLSNKEVGGKLVVSVRTVESALKQIYRKLDVHSRTEMARKLDDAG